MGILPPDHRFSAQPDTAVVQSIVDAIREARGFAPRPELLGTYGSEEHEHEVVIEWLEVGAMRRHRTVFLDHDLTEEVRGVFFTWLAAEWAFFQWPGGAEFWPAFDEAVFGTGARWHHRPADSQRYEWLRIGCQVLDLDGFVDRSHTGWRYVDTLRCQSGVPRVWWPDLYGMLQGHGHSVDAAGRGWAAIAETSGVPKGIRHSARLLEQDFGACLSAMRDAVMRRSRGPVQALAGSHGAPFARDADRLADFLMNPSSLEAWTTARRRERFEQREARRQRSLRRWLASALQVGLFVRRDHGGWRSYLAARIVNTRIPRDAVPVGFHQAGVLRLVAGEGAHAHRRFERTAGGLAWEFAHSGAERFLLLPQRADAAVTLEGRIDSGQRLSFPVLVRGAGALRATAYVGCEVVGFHREVVLREGGEAQDVDFPTGTHPLLVVERDEDVVAVPPLLERVALPGSERDLVVLEAAPCVEVLAGPMHVCFCATSPAPGGFVLQGDAVDGLDAAGQRVFADWPMLRWTGRCAVELCWLRLTPQPSASNGSLPRRAIALPAGLACGDELDLGDLAFDTTVEPSGGEAHRSLPDALMGRFVVEVGIASEQDRWSLRYSFARVSGLHVRFDAVERIGRHWTARVHLTAAGVESLELRTDWERSAGAHVERVVRSVEGRLGVGGSHCLADRAPILGARACYGLTLRFRSDLPGDLRPGFSFPFTRTIDGLGGFIVEAVGGGRVARPLGERTRVDISRLADFELVLFHLGPETDLRFGRKRVPLPADAGGAEPDTRRIGFAAYARSLKETASLDRFACVTVADTRRSTPLPVCVVCSEAVPVPEDAFAHLPPHETARDPTVPELVEAAVRTYDADIQPRIAAWLCRLAAAGEGRHACDLEADESWDALLRLRAGDMRTPGAAAALADVIEELRCCRGPIASPLIRNHYDRLDEEWDRHLNSLSRTRQLVRHLRQLQASCDLGFLPMLLATAAPDRGGGRRLRYVLMRTWIAAPSAGEFQRTVHVLLPRAPAPRPRKVRTRRGGVTGRARRAPWCVARPADLATMAEWELHQLQLADTQLALLEANTPPRDATDPRGPAWPHALPPSDRQDVALVTRAANTCARDWAMHFCAASDALTVPTAVHRLVWRKAPHLTRVMTAYHGLKALEQLTPSPIAWSEPMNDSPAHVQDLPDVGTLMSGG